MALSVSLLGKTCLVICLDRKLCQLVAMALHRIGIAEVTQSDDFDDALRMMSEVLFDLVICADEGAGTSIEMVKRVRREVASEASGSPIICLTGKMERDQLAEASNAGANCILTLPIGTQNILKGVNRALGDSRPTIAHPNYRGPCRRRKSDAKYAGERRRAADVLGHATPPPQGTQPAALSPQRPGAVKAAAEAERLSEGNKAVFAGLGELSAAIEHLRQAQHAADDEPTKTGVRRQLIEVVMRLVNLLALADSRESDSAEIVLRDRVDAAKDAFFEIAEQIAQSRLKAVSDEIDNCLTNSKVSLGLSERLMADLASVEEIVAVMGGGEKFDGEMVKMPRDNQDETGATIRMRKRQRRRHVGKAVGRPK